MCGIAGIISYHQYNKAKLKSMTDLLKSRGPDEEGFFYDKGICLGHRRLSIIDLETGRQPISNEDGHLTIVFNGEIYNYLEIKDKYLGNRHKFKTNTDTEVILHLYEEKGKDVVNYLNGMFSFAIWDSREKELFIARDRVGQKPLYYFNIGGSFAFSSELNSLMSVFPVEKEINWGALQDYLRYQYIPNPETAYKNVFSLSPGEFIVAKEYNGNINLKNVRYWKPQYKKKKYSLLEAENVMETLLIKSVKRRLISDVPLGSFLSGGLDSSLIVALMKKLKDDVATFSISFAEKSYDESKYAELVANFLETEHHTKEVQLNISSDMSKIIGIFGQPFGDASAIPVYFLSAFTKNFVKVALSGDGADELFGGYRRYLSIKFWERINRLPASSSTINIANKLVKKIPDKSGYYGNVFSKKVKFLVKQWEQMTVGKGGFLLSFSEDELKRIFKNRYIPPNEKYIQTFDEQVIDDINYYLTDDILIKVDRMSMANSLEVRAPFLDPELIDFALSLSDNLKIHLFESKYSLKKTAEKYLPKKIIYRSKHGFMLPLDYWFKNDLGEFIIKESKDHWLYKEVLKNLEQHRNSLTDNSVRLWLLLGLINWENTF